MEGFGNEFLPRTAFPLNQDGGLSTSDQLELRQQPLDRWRLPQDIMG